MCPFPGFDFRQKFYGSALSFGHSGPRKGEVRPPKYWNPAVFRGLPSKKQLPPPWSKGGRAGGGLGWARARVKAFGFDSQNCSPTLPQRPRIPDPSQKCSHFLSILSLKLLIFSSGCLPSLSGSRTFPDGLGYKPYVRFHERPMNSLGASRGPLLDNLGSSPKP